MRAGLVASLADLDGYRWCGHATLLGRARHDWHHTDDVLSWFGKSAGAARRAYRDFVKEGVSMGRRSELVGGGLIRSQGGWSEVMAMRKRKVCELYDARILGLGDFVERVLKEAEQDFHRSLKGNQSLQKLEQFILKECRVADVSVNELKSGSRRAPISAIRAKIAIELVKNDGVAMATVARHLGVSTAAISLLLSRDAMAAIG